MKRVFAVLLALCLVLGLCACAAEKETTEAPKTGIAFTFTVIHEDGTEKKFDLVAAEGESVADVVEREGIAKESTTSSGFYDVFDGVQADWNDGEAWWNLLCNGTALLVGIQDVQPVEGDAFEAVFTRGFAE